VSTDRQNHDSQLTELESYCSRRGWKDPEVITDTVSGTKSSREGLDRLMRAVRRGKVDLVVCFKLDRLGRSLSHLAGLIDEFTTHNVALVVPGQGIDTSSANPAAKLQPNILCAVAEFERSIIVERVNAGLAAAKARGVRLGRPPTLEVHRAEVARLRAEGLTGRAIAKELGIPASSAFKLIASNDWGRGQGSTVLDCLRKSSTALIVGGGNATSIEDVMDELLPEFQH
jgi:DNA invertase Pin-like site-specific DNA recombinase